MRVVRPERRTRREIKPGEHFGKLTVIAKLESVNGKARYECQCECGSRLNVFATNLLTGRSKSCGCGKREKMREIAKTGWDNVKAKTFE